MSMYGTGPERERAERKSKRYLEALELERKAREAMDAARVRLEDAKREANAADTALRNAIAEYARARAKLDACLPEIPESERETYTRSLEAAREEARKDDRR